MSKQKIVNVSTKKTATGQSSRKVKKSVPTKVKIRKKISAKKISTDNKKKDISKAPKSFEEILSRRIPAKISKKKIALELLRLKKTQKSTRFFGSPYSYIYASYLRGRKYEKQLYLIENRLTDLGINGKVHRMSQFKSLEEMIRDDAKRGITNIIIVGDDKMFHDAIIASVGYDVVIGMIPFFKKSVLAETLGIPQGIDACDVLSHRIIESFDVGRINDKFFLHSIEIQNQKEPILCNDEYNIFAFGGNVAFYNLGINEDGEVFGDFKDGNLEIALRPKQPLGVKWGFRKIEKTEESIFFAKKASMKSKETFTLIIDGEKRSLSSLDIGVLKQSARVIVGKGRKT